MQYNQYVGEFKTRPSASVIEGWDILLPHKYEVPSGVP